VARQVNEPETINGHVVSFKGHGVTDAERTQKANSASRSHMTETQKKPKNMSFEELALEIDGIADNYYETSGVGLLKEVSRRLKAAGPLIDELYLDE
jgi:cytochrome c biogenesis protein ResB